MADYEYTEQAMHKLEAATAVLRSVGPDVDDASFYEAVQDVRKALTEVEVSYLAEHREVVNNQWQALNAQWEEQKRVPQT